MSYSLKLAIPIALAVIAAIVNTMVMSARVAPLRFVQATRDIAQGEVVIASDLAVLELPGPIGRKLKETAISYNEVGVLLKRRAQRDFFVGDIIFYRDFGIRGAEMDLRPGEAAQRLSLQGAVVAPSLLRIGCELDFLLPLSDDEPPQWHGPFRLVSVGERLGNAVDTSTRSAAASTITVAVQKEPGNAEEAARQAALDRFAVRQQRDNAAVVSVRISPERR